MISFEFDSMRSTARLPVGKNEWQTLNLEWGVPVYFENYETMQSNRILTGPHVDYITKLITLNRLKLY